MRIAYISDIHIEFIRENLIKRAKTHPEIKVPENATEVADIFINDFNWLQETLTRAGKEPIDFIVVAGDVSHCMDDIEEFFTRLNEQLDVMVYYVFGNHDIWNWTSSFDLIDDKIYMLGSQYQLTEDRLSQRLLSLKHVHTLRVGEKIDIVKDSDNSKLQIIGDLGYTGYNLEFGAEQGVYRQAMYSFNDDRNRSNEWLKYYNKIMAERNSDLLVVTHTPIEDWSGKHNPDTSGHVFYINGHTHGQGGYRSSLTYRDDAQNGYEATSFKFGILDTKEVQASLGL